MLTLQSDSLLTKEQILLRQAYTNIVYRLVESTITTSSEFDPFVSKFMGIESVEYDKHQYQALLQTTSYFWASKGGRGSLLEKIIAFLGNPSSTYDVTLFKIISILVTRNNKNRNVNQNYAQWLNKSNIRKLKFDLANIIDDKLILLELKNRVDSGGTAAREEVLSKKFFTLSRLIESEEKIFRYLGKDYDFLKMLSIMGIIKVEMILGLLFNINGKEATIHGDRLNGFYSSSKTQMKKYVNEPHPSIINLKFDESKLSLSFKKRSLEVSINMLYGNEVIQRFSSKPYGVNEIMERVFSTVWDDIWLVLNIAIQQRAMLLSQGKNHIRYLMQLKDNDEHFNEAFTKFCHNSLNQNILLDVVDYISENKDISTVSLFLHGSNQDDNGYLADCLYAFASYIVSKTNIVKSRKKRVDTLDLNKGVLLEG